MTANNQQSIFGMNVDILSQNGNTPEWWWYLVFSGILMFMVMAVWGASKKFMVRPPLFSRNAFERC